MFGEGGGGEESICKKVRGYPVKIHVAYKTFLSRAASRGGSLPIHPGNSGKVIKKELCSFYIVEKCIVMSLQTQWKETSSHPLGVICVSGHSTFT